MCVRADWPGAEMSAVGSQGFDPLISDRSPPAGSNVEAVPVVPPRDGPAIFLRIFRGGHSAVEDFARRVLEGRFTTSSRPEGRRHIGPEECVPPQELRRLPRLRRDALFGVLRQRAGY